MPPSDDILGVYLVVIATMLKRMASKKGWKMNCCILEVNLI